MPRPSWAMYSRTPHPSATIARRASSELLAAVAAQRVEHVAGETLGVDTDEDVLSTFELAAHERDVLLARVAARGTRSR